MKAARRRGPGVTRLHRPPPRSEPPVEVTLADLRAAAGRVVGVAVRSALVDLPALGAVAGAPAGLKCGDPQPTGALKLPRASNAAARLGERGGDTRAAHQCRRTQAQARQLHAA